MATPLERDCDQVRGATLAPSIVTRSTIVNLRTSDRQRAELIELTGKARGMWLVRSSRREDKVRDEAFARASAGHHPLVAIGIDTESRRAKGRARKRDAVLAIVEACAQLDTRRVKVSVPSEEQPPPTAPHSLPTIVPQTTPLTTTANSTMPSSPRLSSSPAVAARTSPTMSSAGQQTFDVRQDLAAQLGPSSRRTSTDSKSTLWTYASTMAPSKKGKQHETRQALSVSPPSYTDAVTTSDKKASADQDDAVLQDVVGKYGLGTSMMCPKVPEFEPKKAKATADTKVKSQSRTPDADDLALQSAMGQYGFGGSMMCPKVPDFEGKDTKKPGKATRSDSSSSSSSGKSSSSSRESLKKAWQRVKSVSPPQTAASFLANR